MKKVYNYVSYCVYSFIPLYILLLIYTIIQQDINDILLTLVLILYSVFSIVMLSYTKPTNIFVFSKNEIVRQRGIDYVYLVLMIIINFLIINEKMNVYIKVVVLVGLYLVLYLTSFKFKSYLLVIIGYKMYLIRDKIVYSKKSEEELFLILKERKSLQVIEVSDNIFIENEKYGMTRFYYKDYV